MRLINSPSTQEPSHCVGLNEVLKCCLSAVSGLLVSRQHLDCYSGSSYATPLLLKEGEVRGAGPRSAWGDVSSGASERHGHLRSFGEDRLSPQTAWDASSRHSTRVLRSAAAQPEDAARSEGGSKRACGGQGERSQRLRSLAGSTAEAMRQPGEDGSSDDDRREALGGSGAGAARPASPPLPAPSPGARCKSVNQQPVKRGFPTCHFPETPAHFSTQVKRKDGEG